jgi:2-amino-4-hydroxy-6-hydroxymethyldihydropteridine diphosphokinase
MKASSGNTEVIYILLGSNKGNRSEQINIALAEITALLGPSVAVSSLYETQPWGFNHEQTFFNQAAAFITSMNPFDLMNKFLEIEKKMGRIRTAEKNTERIIDIDILLYGKDIINQNNLIVPHPLLCERRFALVPLEEIASQVLHPLYRKTIWQLLLECDDKCWVKKL